MGKNRSILFAILIVTIAALFFILRPVAQGESPVRLGLDLQGGSQLTLQAQTTETTSEISDRDMEALRRVVEERINGLGVSESIVQIVGEDQLLVQLPGVSDPQQAERVLGGTAQLEFRPQRAGTEGQLLAERQALLEKELERDRALAAGNEEEANELQESIEASRQAILDLYEPIGLTGDALTDALARPSGNAGDSWVVDIEFNDKGAELFAEATKQVAGTGRGVGIFLDNQLISSPTVDVQNAATGITGGRATIFGNFGIESARDLEVQLRGGALPFPVEVVENRTVGATLGQDSVRQSLYAALGGLVLVLVFMAVYYRLPGILADIALIIYSILTFTAFSLLGVTLTLPGIAGFILSIGMAVDANVLIFERTREELRAGKSLYRSVESGFYRAFSSILDSNVTTLIACAALFWLGTGLVKGFALTLAVGVLISMFTALTCTRTLMFFTISYPQFRKPELYCPNLNLSTDSQTV